MHKHFHCLVSTSILVALSGLLSGCDISSEVKAAITTFDVDVQKVSKSVQGFYTNLNDLERTEYFKQVALTNEPITETITSPEDVKKRVDEYQNPKKKDKDEEKSKDKGSEDDATKKAPKASVVTKTSRLNGRYSSDQILVRIKCLQALSTYTANLALLASSTAAERTGAQLEQLKAPLNDIGSQLQTIKKRNVQNIASDIQNFSGPISMLAAKLGSSWVSHMTDQDLAKSANSAKDDVAKVCDLLADDLDELYLDYNGQVSSNFASTVVAYNLASTDKKEALLSNVKDSTQVLALATNSNPSNLVREIGQIHTDIVDYLNAPAQDQPHLSKFKFPVFGSHHTAVVSSDDIEAKPPSGRAQKIAQALADLEILHAESDYVLNNLDKLTAAQSTTSETSSKAKGK